MRLQSADPADQPIIDMGWFLDPTDRAAAVAAGGRVLGLEGLWVMDASVIARLPSANTHLAVIALAERLAACFAGAGGPAPTAPSGAGRDITAVRVRPDRGPRPGARIRDDDERTRCQSSHRPPPRTPATPP